jgi:uncharacterized protein
MTTQAKLHLVGEQKSTSLVQAGWDRIVSSLNERGSAVLEKLLTSRDCEQLAARYANDDGFRSRIVMSRHGFGRGVYPPLAAIANDWNARLGMPRRYPPAHAEFLAQCHKAGQSRPTPLLLQYGTDDYNCLHQDVYGDLVFPLQVAILLRSPGATSPAANSSSPSSVRACSRAPRWCRSARAMG